MSILLGSSLITEMTDEEREKLLRYLIASYYQPPADDAARPIQTGSGRHPVPEL